MAESERVSGGAFIDSSLVGGLSWKVGEHTCMLRRHVPDLASKVGVCPQVQGRNLNVRRAG